MQTEDKYDKIGNGYPPPNAGTKILLWVANAWIIGYCSGESFYDIDGDDLLSQPTAWALLPPIPR